MSLISRVRSRRAEILDGRRAAAIVTDTDREVRWRYSPRQYLGYTAVRYPELSRNVARSDAAVREFDDPLPDYIR